MFTNYIMKLAIIYTHEDHLELVTALVAGIKEKYQIHTEIYHKDGINNFNSDTLYIFVDLHHFYNITKLPKYYIMYNFLQAECRKKKTLRVADKARNAIQLWDYSPLNIKFFEHSISNIKTAYVPFGYSKTYELSQSEDIKKINAIGFLGDLNSPRRQNIVRDIKNKTGHDITTSKIKLFGDSKARFLRSTKIMLNIHKVDSATILETARIVTLLSNGCFVISEKSNDQDLMNIYQGKVIFADPHEIADQVDYYLKHDEERERIANDAYKWISTEYKTSDLIPDIVQLINNIK